MSLLAAVWAAYSFQATLIGSLGALAIIAGLFSVTILPAFLRYTLIAFGATVLLAAAALQAGQARGAHAAEMLAAERAIQAEAQRADLAEKTRDAIASQAAADNASLAEKNRTLEEILNAEPKDPGADRECVDRDLARRLRNL